MSGATKFTKTGPVHSLLGAGLAVALFAAPVQAAGGGAEIQRQNWSFGGIFGQFDRAQLQRGFQVYKEVCASCHGLKRIAFRNLLESGGPQFSEAGVRSLAASYEIEDGPNDEGSMFMRPGRLSDRFPDPFKNEQEARAANNGAYPPDLSLITKARNVAYHGSVWMHPLSMLRDIATGYQEGGSDYLYALLTDYKEKAPAYRRDGGRLVAIAEGDIRDEGGVERCVAVEQGQDGQPDTCAPMADLMNYNAAFPGHQIAMAPPLSDDLVEYQDGTAGTVANYARDVTAFLSWAADPTLETRKAMGWQVLFYLLVMSILLFFAKRAIWRDVH